MPGGGAIVIYKVGTANHKNDRTDALPASQNKLPGEQDVGSK